jgi:F-type H+-transporting ATPase subunit a
VEVGVYWYWEVAGMLVHGQVFVLTDVVALLLLAIYRGSPPQGRPSIFPSGFVVLFRKALALPFNIASCICGLVRAVTSPAYHHWSSGEKSLGPILGYLFSLLFLPARIGMELEDPSQPLRELTNGEKSYEMLVTGAGEAALPPNRVADRGDAFIEASYQYLCDVARSQLGSVYSPYLPFVGTLFLFVLFSNWLGSLLPWKLIALPAGELAAPTNDINTTVALSLLTSLSYFSAGIGRLGVGFFSRYISPTPLFLPINLLEDVAKPLSLSFRLFGNVLAEEIVVSVLCLLVPIIVPLPVMCLGVFSSAVQALVFSTLSAAYIFESME